MSEEVIPPKVVRKMLDTVFEDDRQTWKAGYDYWAGVSSWSAAECALLMNNLDPRYTPDYFKDFDDSAPRYYEDAAEEPSVRLLWRVQDSYHQVSRLITRINPDEEPSSADKINSSDLLAWINDKSITVAEEFQNYWSEYYRAKVKNADLTVKQLNELLAIAVAKTMWKNDPNASLSSIAQLILDAKVLTSPPTKRRIEQWISSIDLRTEEQKKEAGGRPKGSSSNP
jgi:hypothetical protein